MEEFKPKLSVTDNDIRERKAIRCLEMILSHDDIKTHFQIGDKTANTDGKIELMTERRFFGNITVQIKSYPEKYRGLSKFDFPTSIFGYAGRGVNELVLFFAVDCRENTAFWKYINKSLIDINKDKSNQKTITINFEEFETVHKENINGIVELWKKLHRKTCNLIIRAENIEQENEQLKIQLGHYQDSQFSIGKGSIIKIQNFIDEYNFLLDYEYNSIKHLYYFNSWKIGIAIFKYGVSELSYILHEIRFGENGLLIREIPSEKVKQFEDWSSMYQNCIENSIDQNPKKYAFKLIQEKVLELLERKELLFLTEETAIEYIFDFIEEEGNYIGIVKNESYELNSLLIFLMTKYPRIDKNIQCLIARGKRDIDIKSLYENIKFLVDREFATIQRLYPAKGHFGNTGLVTDWYTPDLAFQKVKFLYELLPSLFASYVATVFPHLKDKITFYKEFDLILVNLDYSNERGNGNLSNCQIILSFFKLCDNSNFRQQVTVSLNYDSNVYRENSISDLKSLNEYFERTLKYQGNNYELRMHMGDESSIFFGRYYIHNLLYKHLNKRFKEFFKNAEIPIFSLEINRIN